MRRFYRFVSLVIVMTLILPVIQASSSMVTAPPSGGSYIGSNPVALNFIYNIERFGSGDGWVQIGVPLAQELGYFSFLQDDAPAETMTTNDGQGNLGLIYPVSGAKKTTLTLGVQLQQVQYNLSAGTGALSDPRAFAPWLVVEQQLPQLMPRAKAMTASESSDAGRAAQLYTLTRQSFASGIYNLGDKPEDMGRLFLQLCRLYGIPARTVYGYRFTTADLNGYSVATIVPSTMDSWVEVYLQGIGWVPADFSSGATFGKLENYLLPLSIENSGLEFAMFSGSGTVMVSRSLLKVASHSNSGAALPVAIISFTERDGYALTGALGLNGDLSYDPGGAELSETEWDQFHSQLEVGETLVRLRVKNAQGVWSRWAQRLLRVIDRASIPIANINLNLQPPYTSNSAFYITGSGSSPAGYSVTELQWGNLRSSYPDGRHQVRLRAQDERGVWSDWAVEELVIGDGIQKPVAVIEYDPPGEVTPDSKLSWSWANSYDPDGDTLIGFEWDNNLVSYPIGVHTVRLRVQNSKGKWSEWATKDISVQSNAPARAPVAVIGLQPDRRDFVLPEEIQILNRSYDLDGDMLVDEEWQGRMAAYNMPGTYTLRLRVQNMRGLWSEWDTVTFTIHPQGTVLGSDGNVSPPGTAQSTETPPSAGESLSGSQTSEGLGGSGTTSGVTSGATTPPKYSGNPNYREDGTPNRAPIAKIQVYPSSVVTPSTQVSLIGTSYDPDWDAITAEEWQNQRTSYPLGENTVRYRVKDSYGLWGEWAEVTIVTVNSRPPVAKIVMAPENPQAGETVRLYGSASSPDGELIVAEEWENRQTSYAAGSHVVRYRAQDSNGTWSDWAEVRFNIKNPWWPW